MMVMLKKLACTGRTIIFTMYHSSTEVFGLFDSICLLANGKMLFFGETLSCLQVRITCATYLLYSFVALTLVSIVGGVKSYKNWVNVKVKNEI